MKKHVFQKVIAVFLAALLLSGCAPQTTGQESTTQPSANTQEDAQNITLSVGELYAFEDAPEKDLDWDLTAQVSQEGVAQVVGARYIMALAPGESDITIETKGKNLDFHVTVRDMDEDRLLVVPDIKDVSVYLGAGYNMLSGKSTINASDLGMYVVNPSDINDAYRNSANGSRVMIMDSSLINKYVQVTGSSQSELTDKASMGINGALNIKLEMIQAGGGAEGSYEDTDTDSSKQNKAYSSVIGLTKYVGYTLTMPVSEITRLVQDNPGVWNSLTGKDGTSVEAFINTYGTHIVTGTELGGYVTMDYTLESTDSNKEQKQLIDIAGQLNASIAGGVIEGEIKAGFKQENGKIKLDSDMSMVIKTSVVGGASAPAAINDINTFKDGYTEWSKGLNTNNITLIGISNLLPVWELLRDNQDEAIQERYNAFVSYYNAELAKLTEA